MGERVNLLVDDEDTEQRVSCDSSGDNGGVCYHRIRTADVWMRDYGPIFVRKEGRQAGRNEWIFNAWGNKYDELLADNRGRVAGERGPRGRGPGTGGGPGGRVDRRQRAWDLPDDGAVPAQQEPQPPVQENRSRATCNGTSGSPTSSGSGTASWATTRTATSTTSPGSWATGG